MTRGDDLSAEFHAIKCCTAALECSAVQCSAGDRHDGACRGT
jgi:hypothetical protein